MRLFTISNYLTLTNLFCGCIAVVFLLTGKSEQVVYLIAIASLCDFFDGFVARTFGTESKLGKELDSLADMVTFGLVPGLIFYTLLGVYSSTSVYLPYLGFVLTLAAALRLAKFNVDERQSLGFIGLATPACTLYVLALLMLFHNGGLLFAEIISEKLFLIPNIFALAFFQVSEIPMFSFKMKNKGWKGNELPIGFLLYTIVLIAIFQYLGLALSIVSYIILSIILNLKK